MITDEDVATLFRYVEAYMSKYHPISGNLRTQIYRGDLLKTMKDQEPGGCNRYLAVFQHFNIIPEYCFSCYKVLIEPRTVLELFKLMIVFDELDLPENNIRKCMVELRQGIRGTYKAYIYSRSLVEATSLYALINRLLNQRVGPGIPVAIKRGCSEYSRLYPEYTRVEDGEIFLDYDPEWKSIEEQAAQYINVNKNESATGEEDKIDSYSLDDYKVMLGWLTYAATIGDESYLQVSPIIRQPLPGLNRPHL